MDYNELFTREYIPVHSNTPESAESILIAMGARSGRFDIEKFKATGAAEAAARMMENTIVNVDEHSPASVAYWTKYGHSYHFSLECQTLRNSKRENIYSGTLQEALDANRTDPCDFCADGHLEKLTEAESAAEEVAEALPNAG